VKILTVVGARPQFIKASPVSKAIQEAGHQEFLLHTGQHYDYGMSQVFFDELSLPEPSLNLGIGSGSHGKQTGEMLIGIEAAVIEQKPDCVLVYGDTNSTLAAALAAIKLQVPLVHVEAGLRSFNREMPEEHNRVLTDHCADLLFCPTAVAAKNLAAEGILDHVHQVGDTMYDAVLQFSQVASLRSSILHDLQMEPKNYMLATVHRPSNTDDPENLRSILSAFEKASQPVLFPVHPRTRQKIAEYGYLHSGFRNTRLMDPVGYLDMLVLEQNASMILTDSGGIQKEAYFFAVPCITLRSETEWVETVATGWNILAGSTEPAILKAIFAFAPTRQPPPPLFGDGQAAQEIARLLPTCTFIHS
jgi:UDP-GlcNAc3NAcA epimerase